MTFNIKGKKGKLCPFSREIQCSDDCALFVVGLQSCVFHAINMNIGAIDKKLMSIDMNLEKK